ncbi:MAG: hypothetical protein LIP04_02360 [Tannerellaceae bacterium]|nr:hypothetical protein [Tannerellaceae bacterium]
MINVPADQGQDWDELIPKARRQIIAKINRFLQTDIEKYIETEQTASPLTIEKTRTACMEPYTEPPPIPYFQPFYAIPTFCGR